MREQVKKVIDLMNDQSRKDVTAYRVWQYTGISQATLSDLKSGKKDIGSLSINNAEKIIKFYEELDNMKTKILVKSKNDKWTSFYRVEPLAKTINSHAKRTDLFEHSYEREDYEVINVTNDEANAYAKDLYEQGYEFVGMGFNTKKNEIFI